MPLSYARAAFDASLVSRGLVMSMLVLFEAQASNNNSSRRNPLTVDLFIAFPFDAQRSRRSAGAVSLRDQCPQELLLLAFVLRLSSLEPPLQGPQRQLVVICLALRFLDRRPNLGRGNSLRLQPSLGQMRAIAALDRTPCPKAGHFAVVHVTQLAQPPQRCFSVSFRYLGPLERPVQLLDGARPHGEQPERLVERVHRSKALNLKIIVSGGRCGSRCLRRGRSRFGAGGRNGLAGGRSRSARPR